MTIIEMPEISAKAYAELNKLSKAKANYMCLTKELPCRKIGKYPKSGTRDLRIWWVNLEKIKAQLEKEQLEVEQLE